MQIVNLMPEHYSLWNAACLDMDEAWFWHTAEWLEYTLHYRADLQPQSFSFMVTHETRVLAICPLILETRMRPEGLVLEFSYGGDSGPAPVVANDLSQKLCKAVRSALSDELDARARRLGVARVSFRESPPAPAFWQTGLRKLHPLLRLGFLDISLATQVIDLSQNNANLLDQMRKGHRCDVKRSQQLLQTEVYDATTITLEIFDQYRRLHHRAAGRVTRPAVTFAMMHKWIEKGMAVLGVARRDGNTIGCALFSIYKNGSYYSSGCEDPDCGNLPVGHALQWEAMRWMKSHGIVHYEIGLQPHGVQPHRLFSQKERNIALFKRGFGGTTVAFWEGEKFYSRECYRAIMRNRIEQSTAEVFAPRPEVSMELQVSQMARAGARHEPKEF